jgi:purine-binding chemotaxis protein CheW
MTPTNPTLQTSEPAASALAGKYLTFMLGDESYGLPVLKVREIIRFMAPTLVPQMPGYIRGVINLRGKVIPVVDLRLKFGLPIADTGERTCIVVVQVESAARLKILTGLVVDGVEEVTQVAAQEIEETPDFGSALDTEYILGMAKLKGKVKTLLDIDKVLLATNGELIRSGALA